MATKLWFIEINGVQYGPYDCLETLFNEGMVRHVTIGEDRILIVGKFVDADEEMRSLRKKRI